MRRPKGISSEGPETSCGSGVPVVSTSRSHSKATRLQPASYIFERYTEVGRMVTFSRMRSIFFTEASLAEDYRTRKTDFPTQSMRNLHAVGRMRRNHRIKKTSFKMPEPRTAPGVRCRDGGCRVAGHFASRGTAGRAYRVESQRGQLGGNDAEKTDCRRCAA